MRHRGDREIHALDALDPADDQRVVAVRPHAQPIGQRRRMIQTLGGDAVEGLETSSGVVRVGEHATAFTEHLRVELEELPAEADVGLAVFEVAVRCAAQLVRRSMLVDHPRDLARVPGEIRRKACGDQQIDGLAVAGREIQQAPCRRLREQFFLRLRAERQGDDFDVMASMPEHVHEGPNVQLRAVRHEWHVRVGDDDSLRLQTGS